MPVRRVSALSQVLSETQAAAQTSTTTQPEKRDTMAVSQDTALPQSDNTVKKQRKTDLRDKVTFYLDPGQLDKLEEMRAAYKKETGTRLSEQDFMRLIINRLELRILL
jgi:hypothetical protein